MQMLAINVLSWIFSCRRIREPLEKSAKLCLNEYSSLVDGLFLYIFINL